MLASPRALSIFFQANAPRLSGDADDLQADEAAIGSLMMEVRYLPLELTELTTVSSDHP